MTIDDEISASMILLILYVIEAVSYTVCVIVPVIDIIHSGINQISLIIVFGSIIALRLITTTYCNNCNWVYSVS